MFTEIKKRITHFENAIDTSMERFIFHHRVLGVMAVFIGMPMMTLAMVCLCTMCITLPIAAVLGWL